MRVGAIGAATLLRTEIERSGASKEPMPIAFDGGSSEVSRRGI